MPLKVVVNGAEKSAVRMEVTVGNAQKRAIRIEAWNGSAWKVAQSFAPAISLSVTPDVFGASSEPTGGLITSEPATATPTGGSAPYTYGWAKISGDTMTVMSPTNATTTFRANVPAGATRSAVYRGTVTDNFGQTATADVSITLSNFA